MHAAPAGKAPLRRARGGNRQGGPAERTPRRYSDGPALGHPAGSMRTPARPLFRSQNGGKGSAHLSLSSHLSPSSKPGIKRRPSSLSTRPVGARERRRSSFGHCSGTFAAYEGVEVTFEIESSPANEHTRRPFSLQLPHRQGLWRMAEITGGIVAAHAAIRQHPDTHLFDTTLTRKPSSLSRRQVS